MDSQKTKKIKKDSHNLKEIWNMFDQEIKEENEEIECVFSKNNKREECELCESMLSITDEGFMACQNPKCGVLYKDVLDHSAEWRFYGNDDNSNTNPSRCGLPINPLLKESSYGCKVICNSGNSYEMKKIRRYTDWQSMPYKEKSQYEEFQRIQIMAQNAGIPKLIIDDAMYYHKMISEAKTFRGCNRDGIIGATIYISCRVNDYPRTAKEIAQIFYLDHTSASKGCKNASSIINELEQNEEFNNKTSYSKTTPSSFIERYCSKLGINAEITRLCMFIALVIEKKDLVPENTPHSIAAGIVYYVAQICNLHIDKKKINLVSEISEVTINKCYKKLENLPQSLIPKNILEKYQKK